MKVDRIEIRNYKGFESCDVDFHPNINVFIGSNASGKTTLLTAIAKSIYNITKRFVDGNGGGNLTLTNNDINYRNIYTFIKANYTNFPQKEDLKFSSFIQSGILTEEIKVLNMHTANDLNRLIGEINNIIGTTTMTIPIIKYYPANRVSLFRTQDNFSDRIPKVYKISQLETWSNIYHNNLSYSAFAKWFIENENNELRLQREHRDFDLQSPALKSIRIALSKAFELLAFGQYKIISKEIKREGTSKLTTSLVLLNTETQKEEDINNKSDGEKAIISLIADIAYNLSIAKDFTRDDDFLKSPGIVMIDEIETHLHPKWQREIIPILREVFPNIQFFVATHSPQIVASVPSECVFVCDNFKVDGVHLKTLGEDTNSLLKYIFDATDRPKEYVKLIEKIDSLIEKNESPESIKDLIHAIELKYNKEDKASGLSNLIDELNIRLAAYEFDRDYEKNN
jgi:predicted ATP-binding protein involved in virulence